MLMFICWSGTRSRAVASALGHPDRGLRGLVPAIETFYSDEVEKGRLWSGEIEERLKAADAGLICITPENARAPWIHYETGFLAARLAEKRKNLYTYLIGVDPRELAGGPLGAYQSTLATYEDTRRMIEALVRSLPDSANRPDLSGDSGEKLFRTWWKDFEAEMARVAVPLEEVISDFLRRFRRKTFDEPLSDCSNQSWLARYEGARETFRELKKYERQVQTGCRTYVADLYQQLVAELDGYAMDVGATLLIEKKFPRDAEGRVAVDPPGAAKSCEGRRQRIKAIVADLVDPKRAPMFEEAVHFQYLETFQEKKNLIHRKAAKIEDDPTRYASGHLGRARNSDWDFDRIVFYLASERALAIDEARRNVEMEFEKFRSKRGGDGLMALHYALGPLRTAIGEDDPNAEGEAAVKELLTRIEEEIERRDLRGPINETIVEIKQTLERRRSRNASSALSPNELQIS